jgi:hypothetical protein
MGAGLGFTLAALPELTLLCAEFCTLAAAAMDVLGPLLAPDLIPLTLDSALLALYGMPTAEILLEAGGTAALGIGAIRAAGFAEREIVAGDASAEELAALLRGLKACSRNSFRADTAVLLADGTSKPIADVAVGDRVASADPASATVDTGTVVQRHRNRDTALADVTVSDPTGADLLHTTADHRFWDQTTKKWTEAASLRPGDALRTTGSATATVRSVRPFAGSQTMFNLTVTDLHTYFVLAGKTPVLVHNDEWCGVGNIADGDMLLHYFDSSKGSIGVIANVQIEGKNVILSDIAVYGEGIPRQGLGLEGTALIMREIRTNVLPQLSAQGFSGGTLTIKGIRVSGPVGHSPDLTFPIP